jgi:hypothetical protein
MTPTEPIEFLEPWEPFTCEQAQAFSRELEIELASGHSLHGVRLMAIAHSGAADDALFQMEDSGVVQVHLTWSGRAEQSPWPRYRVFPSLGDWIREVMIPAHQGR